MRRLPLQCAGCRRRAVIVALLAAGPRPGSAIQSTPVLTEQQSGTTALLQAVSPVDADTVWVSGHEATYARTVDGGRTWQAAQVPGADSLQFRDVHAVDGSTAYLLSAGSGSLSRIYKTYDGGRTWTLQFTNAEPTGFFDCLDFWDADHGMAFSDAVDGRLYVLSTEDGGANWERVSRDVLPPAGDGEGGFAASGTCLVVRPPGLAWIGTGAGGLARVFRTSDRGRTWSVVTTPVVSGTGTSGITSLAFRDDRNGIAVGGEIRDTAGYSDNVAVTRDGGRTWSLAGRPVTRGAFYASAYVPGSPSPTVVAVGPNGADVSADEGATWTNLSSNSYWAVAFATRAAGWMVGPGGRITRVAFP